MSTNFEFVPLEDGRGKPRDLQRSLIRSHCMRGKNKRNDSRRTLREIRRLTRRHGSGDVSVGLLSDIAFSLHTPRIGEEQHMEAISQDQSIRVVSLHAITPQTMFWQPRSRPVDSPVSCSESCLTNCSLGLMHDWSRFLSLKKILYPIESYIDFDHKDLGGMMWLSLDECFLHCVRFSIFAMDDFLHHRPAVRDTWVHLQRVIAQLNDKLGSEDVSLQRSTVYTVALLALSANLFDDHDSAKAHLLGLRRMVLLLGGLKYLEDNPPLRYKLSRLELTLYLHTGYCLPPDGELSWNPTFPLPEAIGAAASEIQLVQDLYPRLDVIFHDLRVFSSRIQDHLANGSPMKVATFQSQIDLIQSRLLQHQLMNCDALSEALRLGMLAYIVATFGLPRGSTPYKYLSQQLYHALLEIDLPISNLPRILFWVLMVGCMTGLNIDEAQLLICRMQLSGHKASWDDARQSLQSVMWIDRIHNERGQDAFMKLRSAHLEIDRI